MSIVLYIYVLFFIFIYLFYVVENIGNWEKYHINITLMGVKT